MSWWQQPKSLSLMNTPGVNDTFKDSFLDELRTAPETSLGAIIKRFSSNKNTFLTLKTAQIGRFETAQAQLFASYREAVSTRNVPQLLTFYHLEKFAAQYPAESQLSTLAIEDCPDVTPLDVARHQDLLLELGIPKPKPKPKVKAFTQARRSELSEDVSARTLFRKAQELMQREIDTLKDQQDRELEELQSQFAAKRAQLQAESDRSSVDIRNKELQFEAKLVAERQRNGRSTPDVQTKVGNGMVSFRIKLEDLKPFAGSYLAAKCGGTFRDTIMPDGSVYINRQADRVDRALRWFTGLKGRKFDSNAEAVSDLASVLTAFMPDCSPDEIRAEAFFYIGVP
eukprot:m.151814 g.151814  ORF g.151814 m.151814 type:complete len:341 (-) comp52837_c0_seq2:105-1127(-)